MEKLVLFFVKFVVFISLMMLIVIMHEETAWLNYSKLYRYIDASNNTMENKARGNGFTADYLHSNINRKINNETDNLSNNISIDGSQHKLQNRSNLTTWTIRSGRNDTNLTDTNNNYKRQYLRIYAENVKSKNPVSCDIFDKEASLKHTVIQHISNMSSHSNQTVDLICLATQLTPSRLSMLKQVAQHWSGINMYYLLIFIKRM